MPYYLLTYCHTATLQDRQKVDVFLYGVLPMVTLSDDEVALIRKRSYPKESLLTALRAIKVREIDKALVILSKQDKGIRP
jgi:hypothetical protein